MSRRITDLEDHLNDMKKLVERRDAILRLADNRDFRVVIREAFMVEECARYARESGDPALTPNQREDALNMAQAAGHLKRFLNIAIQIGDQAAGSIEAINEALDEERAADQDTPEPVETVELG